MINNIGITSLEEIQDYVVSADVRDLSGKVVCYRCVATGVPAEHCLRYPQDMQESPETLTSICEHCYVTEIDLGYERMTLEESKLVFEIVKKFEALIADR